MKVLYASWLGLILGLLALPYPANAADFPYEELINDRLIVMPLTGDNLFRVAAYAELKGDYQAEGDVLTLEFGDRGSLSMYEKRMLLKTGGNVLELTPGKFTGEAALTFNQVLGSLFEDVMLMGNHDASVRKRFLIDQCLARKNLEPFAKIYLRHILLKYGTYDPVRKEVTFKTADFRNFPDLPADLRKTKSNLMLRINERMLRGYYLSVGGTVYLEDVDRPVRYATGEDYSYNVSPFKLFIQKLFSVTAQHITRAEKVRTARMSIKVGDKKAHVMHPHNELSWIPMMLGMLRSQNINIGDADIICYFVEEAYFSVLYGQLLPGERVKVDRYVAKHKIKANT